MAKPAVARDNPRDMSEIDAWTTVRVAMPDVATEHEALIGAIDRIEGLAALLAERDDIGGVEVRDPSCIAEGPEFVAVERPELIAYTTPDAREAVMTAARELAAQLGMRVTVDAEDHVGDDWRDAWKRHYRPLRFSAGSGAVTLLIRPSWIERAADDPKLELILDPGRAFGTGLHESTRLCLRALVEHAASSATAPTRALDLGCGSGILGLAAARLWPQLLEPGALLLGDHDPEAVETARENAELNGMPSIGFAPITLAQSQSAPGEAPSQPELPATLAEFGPADLILANIRPKVLIPAAPTIAACLAPGGILVLSGILDEEGDSVRAAYPQLEQLARLHEADWCALVLRRSEG